MARRVFVHALGHIGKPRIRPASDVVGDVDVAAFAAVPRDATRYEGRGRHVFPAGHQSARGPRLAVFAGLGGRARLVVLRGGGLQQSQSLVDRDAGCDELSDADELILRQGKPANDVAVLLPEEDAQARFRPGDVCVTDRDAAAAGNGSVPAILDAGYNSTSSIPQRLTSVGIQYPVLVIPARSGCRWRYRKKIADYVRNGAGCACDGRAFPRARRDSWRGRAISAAVQQISQTNIPADAKNVKSWRRPRISGPL